jgi:hypothetical protein
MCPFRLRLLVVLVVKQTDKMTCETSGFHCEGHGIVGYDAVRFV